MRPSGSCVDGRRTPQPCSLPLHALGPRRASVNAVLAVERAESVEEIVALAQKARAAVDDQLAAIRSIPVPNHEPFAAILQRVDQGYTVFSESYTVLIDGLDTLDEQRLNEADQLRADGLQAVAEATIEFQQLMEEIVAEEQVLAEGG